MNDTARQLLIQTAIDIERQVVGMSACAERMAEDLAKLREGISARSNEAIELRRAA